MMQLPLEGHTVRRYDGELGHLHLLALEMGGLVLYQTQQALAALRHKDLGIARAVMERDRQVNNLEVATDDAVITVIARRAPVARDLRAVMALSKIATDLERIGDDAVRIAHLALAIYGNEHHDPSTHLLRDVHTMGKLVTGMLKRALEALDDLGADKARALIAEQYELDMEFQAGFRRLITFIMEDPRNVGHAINIVLISKALERIGDHARTIAEYVVYQAEGKDIRLDQPEDYGEDSVPNLRMVADDGG